MRRGEGRAKKLSLKVMVISDLYIIVTSLRIIFSATVSKSVIQGKSDL